MRGNLSCFTEQIAPHAVAENQRETEQRLAALTEAIRARVADSPEAATEAMSAAELDSQSAGAIVHGGSAGT